MDLVPLLIALAFCISVHEAAHAWTASLLGDDTARLEGRVSLNPLRHLDPVGTLMIFLVQFGWGKPTPFDPRNLAHPRRDSALIALAGPISNLISALIFGALVALVQFPPFLTRVFFAIYQLSTVLFLFNLIPIAPLDGSKFIGFFLPPSKQAWYERFLAQGPLFLILFIVADRLLLKPLLGFSILDVYLDFGYGLISLLLAQLRVDL